MTQVLTLTQRVTPECVATEDSGMAKVVEFEANDRTTCLFVRLHSWDEAGPFGHQEFDRLIGKTVRVTVEIVEGT